jgi:hypothetical protein
MGDRVTVALMDGGMGGWVGGRPAGVHTAMKRRP